MDLNGSLDDNRMCGWDIPARDWIMHVVSEITPEMMNWTGGINFQEGIVCIALQVMDRIGLDQIDEKIRLYLLNSRHAKIEFPWLGSSIIHEDVTISCGEGGGG